jgi:hypothetical protein
VGQVVSTSPRIAAVTRLIAAWRVAGPLQVSNRAKIVLLQRFSDQRDTPKPLPDNRFGCGSSKKAEAEKAPEPVGERNLMPSSPAEGMRSKKEGSATQSLPESS